jgi:hypothetical protein
MVMGEPPLREAKRRSNDETCWDMSLRRWASGDDVDDLNISAPRSAGKPLTPLESH